MHHLWAWVLHILGVDDASGRWYLFWSGFIGDITLLFAVIAWPWLQWKRHECLVRWCWRIGRHPFEDPADHVIRNLCWRHHPAVQHKNITRERLHLYLGDRPGRG